MAALPAMAPPLISPPPTLKTKSASFAAAAAVPLLEVLRLRHIHFRMEYPEEVAGGAALGVPELTVAVSFPPGELEMNLTAAQAALTTAADTIATPRTTALVAVAADTVVVAARGNIGTCESLAAVDCWHSVGAM